MPTVDPLVLRLQADLAQYNRKIEASTVLVDRSLKRQEQAVSRLELQVARSSGAIGAGFRGIAAAAAGVSVVALARQFLSYADAAKQMEAQLRLATSAFGTFGQAQQDVARIAGEARAGLQETTALYGSFIRSAQELGKTQSQAAVATETFTKALKIGGAAPQQVASATLQLGQALSSANVQWEELGQILEASPRLAKVFTDSLGVTRGQLKKMAEDGKLSAEQLFDALNRSNITKQINEEFKTLPVTFADAMQQVENAAQTVFGAFDRGGGFSTALANFITDGTGGFAELERAAEQMGSSARGSIEGLADAFQPVLDTGIAIFDALGIRVDQFGKDGRQAISELLGALDEASGLLNRGRGFLGGNPNSYKVFGVETVGPALRPQFDRSSAASDRSRALDRVVRNGNLRLREDILRPPSRPAPRVTEPDKGAAAAKKKAEREAAAAARKAEAERQRELRNDEAFANEKAALNQDILRARQSLATAADVIAQYELQEIEAARVRQNASYQSEAAQGRLTKARAAELVALNDKVAIERSAVVNAREAERKRADAVSIAQADLTNAQDLASAEAQLAVTAADRRAASQRLLDLEFQMEKARLDAILASTQSTEAEKEIARRRLAILPGLKAAEDENLKRQNEGPIDQYKRQIRETGADLQTAAENIGVDALRDLNAGLVEAILNSKSLADLFDNLGSVFKNVAASIIQDMIRIAIQQAVIAPLLNALGGGIGSLFGGGSAAGFKVFGRASGGYVGPGQTVRVNEQRGGMELLRMGSQGGTVIPLGQANATARPAATTIIHAPQFNLRGAVITQELYRDMQRISSESAAAAGQASYKQAMRDAPGAVSRAQRFGTT